MSAIRRVLKLGGSLLDGFDWLPRFRRWHAAQPAACDWLVAGGGIWVERLRHADRMVGLGDVPSHWVALGLMSVTARQVAAQLGWPAVDDLESLGRPGPMVVDVGPLTEAGWGAPWTVPPSWDVTSDSLAAWLAGRLAADELVLLKSRAAKGAGPVRRPYRQWVAEGVVDAYFPNAVAEGTRVRIVNLRG